MAFIEKEARTVEEAVEAALKELGVGREAVDIEVLTEPSKGLFGIIGTRAAKVKVTQRSTKAEKVVGANDACLVAAKDFLQAVFETMKIPVSLEKLRNSEQTVLNLRGEDLGVLIGKHGQTLDALQYLTYLVANKAVETENRVRIVLDVEDYRRRRTDTLRRLAYRLADRVKKEGATITLEPMNSHERKVIHTCLQNDRRVTTFSEGNEPYRKVIIALRSRDEVANDSDEERKQRQEPVRRQYRRGPAVKRSNFPKSEEQKD